MSPSSTPSSDGWARSTSMSGQDSSPSEAAPSSAPTARSSSTGMTLRRPLCRRAMPSSSRSSSSGSIRTFESEPMQSGIPRVEHALDREEAVAEVRLGRRAGADRARRAPRAGRARRRRVRRVHDRRARAEAAGAREQLDRPHAVLGEALLDLARLLVRVDVQRQALAARRTRPSSSSQSRGAGAHGVGGDGRRGCPAARRSSTWPAGTRRPTPGGSARCRRGRTRRRGGRARCPPRRPPRRRRAPPRGRGSGTRRPPCSRRAHLAVDAGVAAADESGGLALGLGQHQLAPGPEVAALGAAAQRPLERVRVRVDESGQPASAPGLSSPYGCARRLAPAGAAAERADDPARSR